MTSSKIHAYFAIKVFIAIAMLSALISIASADMAPGVSLISILITCAIAAAILLTILGCAVLITASVNQEVIRHGGTDSAWFWFNGEPPGLEKLRAELKEFEENKL
ncbi:MAG: hypothetical protein RI956_748 [Pseudomonadota bacterium]|jgi:hypothetical protein